MSETIQKYLLKSEESLASSRDDLTKKRFNSCANRTYYACYQAAVAVLVAHEVTPPSKKKRWEHDVVQAQLSNLIRRKKILPSEHRGTLSELIAVRITADYEPVCVSKRKAKKVLKMATDFVTLANKEASK